MLRNIEKKVLSDFIYDYSIYHFEFFRKNQKWQQAKRLVLDKGDGAAVLMVDRNKEVALFVRQFRYPTYINERLESFIEVCAGVLDGDSPEDCVRREAIEETGFAISNIKKIFDSYMSPGAVTERLHLFIADYDSTHQIEDGGGLDHETEDIDLVEVPFSNLKSFIDEGKIRDAKSIMLIQHFLIQQ